jgi:hypothetical protein
MLKEIVLLDVLEIGYMYQMECLCFSCSLLHFSLLNLNLSFLYYYLIELFSPMKKVNCYFCYLAVFSNLGLGL